MKLFGLFAFFLFLSIASALTINEEIDCGYVGITEDQCVEKGCYWLPNFAGPWCQNPDSPFLPGNFYSGIHGDLSEDLQSILAFSVGTLVVLSIFIYWYSFTDQRGDKSVFLSADTVGASLLLVVSAITRFYKLEMPGEVAFDEFYFGSFANWYCNKVYVFDIHPPLAKITHWLAATALGHQCTFDFTAEAPNDKYNAPEEYIHMRQVSAIFGTLVIPLAFLLARRIGLSLAASVVVATLVFADHLLLSETRLILTDSQLFFYSVLALYCAFSLWQSNGRASKWRTSFWVIATAVSCGCAFSVKFTALATLGWISFVTITSYYPYGKPLSVRQCMAGAIIGLAVLCVPFYIHFQRGVYSGTGDWNLDVEHQQLLIGNEFYNPRARPPGFFRHLYYIVDRMIEQNRMSLGSHPYASYWYQWLRGRGALLSYSEHHDELDFHAHIFIQGNMVVAHMVLAAIGIFTVISLWLVRLRYWYKLSARHWAFVLNGSIFVFGWFSHLAPYALVERTTYSYHYLPAQFFGMLLVGVVVDFVMESIALLVAQLLRPSAVEEQEKEGEKGEKEVEAPKKAEAMSLPDRQVEAPVMRMPNLPSSLYLGDLEWIRVAISCSLLVVILWSYYFFAPFAYGFPLTQFEFAMRNFVIDQGV